MSKEQYVLLDDVNDLIQLYNEREKVADYVSRYETLTRIIEAKIESINENAEEF